MTLPSRSVVARPSPSPALHAPGLVSLRRAWPSRAGRQQWWKGGKGSTGGSKKEVRKKVSTAAAGCAAAATTTTDPPQTPKDLRTTGEGIRPPAGATAAAATTRRTGPRARGSSVTLNLIT